MSITMTAVPIALFSTLEVVFTGVTLGAVALNSAANAIKKNYQLNDNNFNIQYIHLEQNELNQLLKKEYKTTIMDSDTLIKTLEEHGATEIENKNGTIICTCEAFHLTFTKNTESEPYSMIAIFNEEYGLDNLVQDLGEEYALNSQEVSYNTIKAKLEEQNLQISDEEVYDDNTIVLTIDLD
jgi:hypothetical protein